MEAADARPDGRHDDVLELCAALRQAVDELGLDESAKQYLLEQLTILEGMARNPSVSTGDLHQAVKVVRYILLETAVGPLAPFLADAAALIIGDGHGRIFF
jgi:hypothetical protein